MTHAKAMSVAPQAPMQVPLLPPCLLGWVCHPAWGWAGRRCLGLRLSWAPSPRSSPAFEF